MPRETLDRSPFEFVISSEFGYEIFIYAAASWTYLLYTTRARALRKMLRSMPHRSLLLYVYHSHL